MPNKEKPSVKNNKSIKTIKKLLNSLKKYQVLIIIALVVASFSSILSLSSPNLLKKLTDKISAGVGINNNNFNLLVEDISKTFNEENINNELKKILDIKIDNNLINILRESGFDVNKINDFQNIKDEKEYNRLLLSIDDGIFNIILRDSKYHDVLITKEEKLDIIKKLKNNDMTFLKDLPLEISYSLLPDTIINDVNITTSDKIIFLEVLSAITDKKDISKLSKKLDTLPKSVSTLLTPKMNLSYVKKLSLILFIIFILSSIFNYIEGLIMIDVANKYGKDLRSKISKKINLLPLNFFDNNTSGDILSRITNDIDTISEALNESLSSLVAAITMFIGSIIMMFITNSLMAVTAIISSLLGFVLVSIILSKSQKYFNAKQTELGKLNGYIEEAYSSLNVIKTCNAKEEALKEFDSFNKKVYECTRKSHFLSGLMQPIMIFVGNLGYVCVCIVGAILVSKDMISFGVVVAFIMYVRLFISPLAEIAEAVANLQMTVASSERVFDFLEEKELPLETNSVNINEKKVKGKIEFQNVRFGYNKDKIIIKNFNAIARPGEKIAIVGPTGAGKTTMVNLLMKFYDITSGDIKIDGISIKDIKRSDVHKLFTMVLQDTWLFNGTVKENLIYNRNNITNEKLEEVSKIVGIDHFIKTLPKGFDTILSSNDSVSAGEKQLLTIARAMLVDTPFLILDEATSNVDTRTEELVQDAMDKLIKNKTSFIIAHRLSTIKNANLILVMKDGDIIEAGTHDELIKLGGFYEELYNSQFEKVE